MIRLCSLLSNAPTFESMSKLLCVTTMPAQQIWQLWEDGTWRKRATLFARIKRLEMEWTWTEMNFFDLGNIYLKSSSQTRLGKLVLGTSIWTTIFGKNMLAASDVATFSTLVTVDIFWAAETQSWHMKMYENEWKRVETRSKELKLLETTLRSVH